MPSFLRSWGIDDDDDDDHKYCQMSNHVVSHHPASAESRFNNVMHI